MKARPIIFGLSTAFMFFNPGLSFEIFPYWLILIPTLKKFNSHLFYIILISTLIIITNLLFFENIPTYLLDSLQFLSIFFAFLIYSNLLPEERLAFFRTLTFIIWIQFFIMILQSNFQSIQSFISSFFRTDQYLISNALLRNNAVTGFSPEPSYGSALLVGIYFMLVLKKYNNKFIIIPVLGSLLLLNLFMASYYFIYFLC